MAHIDMIRTYLRKLDLFRKSFSFARVACFELGGPLLERLAKPISHRELSALSTGWFEASERAPPKVNTEFEAA